MLKLLKHKKAEKEFWAADTGPFFIIFGITLNVVFVMFLLATNSSAEAKTKIPENLEEFTVNTGFLFDKDCFLYSDNEVVRAYKLDYNKFNEDNLNNCVQSKHPIRLTLKSAAGEKAIKTKNWDVNKPPKKTESAKHVGVFIDKDFVKAKLLIELQ